MTPRLTYVGGPTALLELAGLRLLTDPTFDAAGTAYTTPVYTLHKRASPALDPAALGAVDLVLLSHDHHFDNLDHAGRRLLDRAGRILTTRAGAERLGGRAVGLAAWERTTAAARDGCTLHITATPARHGPADGDRGPVIGFVLEPEESSEKVVYVSGDTVWYEGVGEVARRFAVNVALLFAGAARVREVGPSALTMTAADAVHAARAFSGAQIIPLHFEDWGHFSESAADLERAFAEAGLADRLRLPPRGKPIEL